MSTSAEVALGPWISIFERFPFAAVMVERGTTRLIRANRAAAELLDLDTDAVGQPGGPHLADLVTQPLDQLDEDLRIAAGGGDLPLVLRSPVPNKPTRQRCQVVPITFADRADRWMVTFSCNLRRLDRFEGLNAKLQRANDEAARQRQLNKRATDDLRTLERFAQAMAHDLKGPLRHIGTLLPAIEDSIGDELPPESRRLMDLARQSAERGRELVDALLIHATAVSGELRPGPVDLDQLVEASVAEQQWNLGQIPHRISRV
ncbi:MAG: histidine kinase dimerization/phospho-acceptor domain-containing protein, partial [Actinomycetota bacterium]